MIARPLAAAVAALLMTSAASAATVAALIGGDTIATIDTAQKKATGSVKVTGISGALVGIDVRPADGLLYGLVDDGSVVTIAADGKATLKSKLDTMVAKGVAVTVDFNPVADRLRVMVDIDATIGALVKQAPPNDGVLGAVGRLGIMPQTVAFDIWSDGSRNDAWLMAGDTLYSVDLATGKATEAARISGVAGRVTDIAIMGM